MLIRCIDFETTDTPENNGEIIEAGWTDVYLKKDPDGSYYFDNMDGPHSILYNYARHMNPSAQSAHHIQKRDVESNWVFDSNDAGLITSRVTDQPGLRPDYLLAHNAEFEREMLKLYGRTGDKIICTMRVARHIYTTAENWNLQYLRYWLNLELGISSSRSLPAHRAGPDTYVNALLFIKLLNDASPDHMWTLTNQPVFYPTCPIGKYKGKPWSEVDYGYLKWMKDKAEDMDPDLKAAAQTEINLRYGGNVKW